MQTRITDFADSVNLSRQINTARQRLAAAQEQVTTGKRINRPSDDPNGTATVIRLQTRQTELEQLKRNAATASDRLNVADFAADSYQQQLDRARVLLAQGGSDAVEKIGRQAIAEQIENIRSQVLTLANTRHDDQYLFGGTRQDAPPVATDGTPAATPSGSVLIQVEPQAEPIVAGITTEALFADATGNVFDALSEVAAALRGTGDEAADRVAIFAGLDRLRELADQASLARTQIGASQAHLDVVLERLTQQELTVVESTERTESADFVRAATDLNNSQQVLEAILQANAPGRRRSLIDLLG
jgi:flagellar hook-associated protein 3 FlgL